MIIERETKERFVRMLKNREIIVINCKKNPRRLTRDFKFIGANSYGKWDFTPMIEDFTNGRYSYRSNGWESLAIRSTDAAAVVCEVLDSLKNENIESGFGNGHEQYEKVRDRLCTFYL